MSSASTMSSDPPSLYPVVFDKRSTSTFLSKHKAVGSLEKGAFETALMKMTPWVREWDDKTVNVELNKNHWVAFFRDVAVDKAPFTKEAVAEIKLFAVALSKTPPFDIFEPGLIDVPEGMVKHNCFMAAWVAATQLHGHAWNLIPKKVKEDVEIPLDICVNMLRPTAHDSQKIKAAFCIVHLVLDRPLETTKYSTLLDVSFIEDNEDFEILKIKIPAKKDGKIEGLPAFPKPSTEKKDNADLKAVWQSKEYGSSIPVEPPTKKKLRTQTSRVSSIDLREFRLKIPNLPAWSSFQTFIQRGREILVVLRLCFPEADAEALDNKFDELFDECKTLPDTNKVIHGLLKELKDFASAEVKKAKAAQAAIDKEKKAEEKRAQVEDTAAALAAAEEKHAELGEDSRKHRNQKKIVDTLKKELKKDQEAAKKASETSKEWAEIAAAPAPQVVAAFIAKKKEAWGGQRRNRGRGALWIWNGKEKDASKVG